MNYSNYFENRKRIAIVAYADKRKDIIEWSYFNKHILKHHLVITTRRTGDLLEGTLQIPVCKLASGRAGGFQELISLVEADKIDIIIFFGRPLKVHPKDSALEELLNVSIRHDIVVAYNQATIDIVMSAITKPDSPESTGPKALIPWEPASRN